VGPIKFSFRVNHPPKKFPTYVALMSSIIGSEPSNFEEARAEQVWQDSITEEYNSTLKNDVSKIVLRLVRKSAIDSRQVYKIKHALMGA
jgi:hypothetical protein